MFDILGCYTISSRRPLFELTDNILNSVSFVGFKNNEVFIFLGRNILCETWLSGIFHASVGPIFTK